ncbi:defensin-like [Anopheles ziemanni]|uniref:defensin-like n=1 Tax=Anopheles coustani TaxID=139045 RepID=UPI002659F180|nr:defensin-like [Anopheles coustani]XP_058168843.1 defensin-like [Anopheles ziemanni]
MKCSSIVFTVAVVLAVTLNSKASAEAPTERQQPLETNAALNTLFDELPGETHHTAIEHNRAKRATCDLASGFGVGSSLCAAHCIAKRYRGGYCNRKRVCVCRR